MMTNTTLPPVMRAALFHGPHTLTIEQLPVPSCQTGEVLIQVEAVCLCGSDVHFYTGERPLVCPMILRNEVTGRIVLSGSDVSPERIGQRVVVEPNIPCGQCAYCQRG